MRTNKFYKIGITGVLALLLLWLMVVVLSYPSSHVKWMYKASNGIVNIEIIGSEKYVLIQNYHGIAVVDARTGKEEWTHKIDSERQYWLVGPDSKIIVVTSGQVEAFNLATGNKEWTYKPKDTSGSSVTLFKDKVICTTNQKVAVLDGHTGRPTWSLNQANENFSTAVGIEGLVYIEGDKLTAYDARTGRMRWSFAPLGGLAPFEMGLCKHLFVSEGSTHALYALDPLSGKVLWKSQVPESCTPLGLDKDHRHVIMHSYDSLYDFDLASGKLNWKYETNTSIEILGPENNIYFADRRRGMVCLDEASGRVRWTTHIAEKTSEPVLGPGNTLYLCADLDQFTVLNRETGAVIDHFRLGASLMDRLNLSYRLGGDLSTEPVIGSDGTIYVGSIFMKAFAFHYPR